jgi:hypothetical protein
MQGSSDPNRELLDATAFCRHLVEKGSVADFLTDHRQELFPDELFGDLFPSGRGRPSVPADVVATVMVLQSLEGLSDRDAARQLRTNIAWKAATGMALDYVRHAASGAEHSCERRGLRGYRLHLRSEDRRSLEAFLPGDAAPVNFGTIGASPATTPTPTTAPSPTGGVLSSNRFCGRAARQSALTGRGGSLVGNVLFPVRALHHVTSDRALLLIQG